MSIIESKSTGPTVAPQADDKVEFLFDLRGRIRNISLPASQANSLIPLFEAISNSLHAIEARFPLDFKTKGDITVTVVREHEDETAGIEGFSIRDNGIGLTDEHMKAFRTSDSGNKAAKGGKGVGRLTWLKAFDQCEIKSWFERDGKLLQRSFTFSLRQDNPISKHTVIAAPSGSSLGTEVVLSPFLTPYSAYCPKRQDTIAAKIVGHFLNYFAADNLPHLELVDKTDTDLRNFIPSTKSGAR